MKFFWWNKKISIIQAAISVKNILIYLYSICKVLVWMNIKYNQERLNTWFSINIHRLTKINLCIANLYMLCSNKLQL